MTPTFNPLLIVVAIILVGIVMYGLGALTVATHRRTGRIVGKSRARLLLDHHEEVEGYRRIIADQNAEIEELRDLITRLDQRANTGNDYAARLHDGALRLAESWERLGHVGSYHMAAAELLGMLQQLSASDRPALRVASGGDG